MKKHENVGEVKSWRYKNLWVKIEKCGHDLKNVRAHTETNSQNHVHRHTNTYTSAHKYKHYTHT